MESSSSERGRGFIHVLERIHLISWIMEKLGLWESATSAGRAIMSAILSMIIGAVAPTQRIRPLESFVLALASFALILFVWSKLCPGRTGSKLIIISARYGIDEERSVPVELRLRANIERDSISIHVANELLVVTDPYPRTGKVLIVKYSYAGETKEIVRNEGTWLVIPEEAFPRNFGLKYTTPGTGVHDIGSPGRPGQANFEPSGSAGIFIHHDDLIKGPRGLLADGRKLDVIWFMPTGFVIDDHGQQIELTISITKWVNKAGLLVDA